MTSTFSAMQALAIIESCPFPLVVLDASDRVRARNQAFEQLCAQGRAVQDPVRGPQAVETLLSDAMVIPWCEPDGRQRYLEVHRFTLPEADGGEVRIFVDVTRHVRLEQAGESLDIDQAPSTLTDAVTGVLNRRGLKLALEPQVARSRRYNSSLSVVMLSIIETVQRGAVLTDVARLLRDQLRWADLIGCTSRGDFILVLPETTSEAAHKLTDKLGRLLSELRAHRTQDSDWFCFAIAEWRRTDSASTLLERASSALARAALEPGRRAVAR
jgi:diguanylate cyclase (GGDEF)-like protein